MLIDSFSAARLLFLLSAAALLPVAFGIKNAANYTSSSTVGGGTAGCSRQRYWEAASDHCGTSFILNQIIKHVRGPFALIYPCE